MTKLPEKELAGRFLLAAALICSVALLLPMAWAGPLALDEHGSYWIIDSGLPGSSLERALNYTAIPPLSAWLQGVSIRLLGKSEFAFRLPMALSALAAVVTVYFVGKQLHDSLSGGIAALLLAWHPEALDEVRIGRCYGLVLFLAALVLLATVCWLKSPRSIRWAVMWGGASAGLIWTHYTSALLVAATGALLILPTIRSESGRIRCALPWLTGMAITVGLSVPLIPAALRIKEWGPYLNYMATRQPFWHVVGPIWWSGLPAGLLVAWALNRGRASTAPKRMLHPIVLMAVCSLLPLLAIALMASSEDASSLANPRYRTAYAPPAACLIALLLTAVGNWRSAGAGAAVVLIAGWSLSPLPPWQLGRLGHPADQEWFELSKYLVQHARKGEPIVVQSGLVESNLVPAFPEDRLFMEYAASRVSRFYVEQAHPRYALPSLWNEKLGIIDFYRRLVSSWAKPGATFWVASATDTDLNRNSLEGIVRIARECGFTVVNKHTWPTVTLIEFTHPSPASDG